MSSAGTRPGRWPRGLLLRAFAFFAAVALPGAAAVAAVPKRPSGQGLLLYAVVTAAVLLAVPVLAEFGVLTGLARAVLVAMLPRVRFDSGGLHRPAARCRSAAGVFRGPRGLGGLLDDLRHRLARRGPPAAGGIHAI